MRDYHETMNYWNAQFSTIKPTVLTTESCGYEGLDKALDWLSETAENVLDFGCGSGAMLAFLAKRKLALYCGIDPSSAAIKCAEQLFALNGFETGVFQCGSTALLKQKPANHYDGAILSNILDNLHPSDALDVLCAMQRVLKPKGRLLLKLNPYYDAQTIQSLNMTFLEPDFYLETTGLYLWNKPDAYWLEQLRLDYTLIEQTTLTFKPHTHTNRLFLYQRNLK